MVKNNLCNFNSDLLSLIKDFTLKKEIRHYKKLIRKSLKNFENRLKPIDKTNQKWYNNNESER